MPMQKKPENPYDLLPLTIAGEQLYVRPIEFLYDAKTNEATEAIKYVSTCPKCAQLLEVEAKDIIESNDKYYYSACSECPLPQGLKSNTTTNDSTDNKFNDPIKNGKMILDGATRIDA